MNHPVHLNDRSARQHAVAWVALALALALHVADEALTDFLAVYNPAVEAIRQRLPFLPLPTFTFGVWLTGLITVIILLLCLTGFVRRGARWAVLLSYVFGGLMLMNGLLHIAGSFYLGRPMPGVYSSPVLIGFPIFLLASARRRKTVPAPR